MQVVAAVLRTIGGNFRLVVRLLTQAVRFLEVNALATIALEVVAAARDSLVIGGGKSDGFLAR